MVCGGHSHGHHGRRSCSSGSTSMMTGRIEGVPVGHPIEAVGTGGRARR